MIKRYRFLITLLAIIVLLCGGYILFNHLNSNNTNVVKNNKEQSEDILFKEDVKILDNSTADNKCIAYAVLCVNLEKFKEDKYSNVNGSNLRIYDYVVNSVKTQSTSGDKFFILCESSVKPYDMNSYLVGGGSTNGEWQNRTRFYTVEKLDDGYVITSIATGPSEEMLKGEFK